MAMEALDPGRDAKEVGTALYRLALRYWSEGRPDDAARVARQAARILRGHSPDSPLLHEVASILDQLEKEPDQGPAIPGERLES